MSKGGRQLKSMPLYVIYDLVIVVICSIVLLYMVISRPQKKINRCTLSDLILAIGSGGIAIYGLLSESSRMGLWLVLYVVYFLIRIGKKNKTKWNMYVRSHRSWSNELIIESQWRKMCQLWRFFDFLFSLHCHPIGNEYRNYPRWQTKIPDDKNGVLEMPDYNS